jgi:hypothetical protein
MSFDIDPLTAVVTIILVRQRSTARLGGVVLFHVNHRTMPSDQFVVGIPIRTRATSLIPRSQNVNLSFGDGNLAEASFFARIFKIAV